MFDVIVWRSLRQAPPFTDFLTELMSAIAPEQSLPVRLDAKIRQLLEQLRHHRCLLILDDFEAVMQGGELVGTYQPGYENYGRLFQQLGTGRHQSTILLLSREIPAEVAIQQGITSPIRLLRLKPLSSDAGKLILTAKGLTFPAEPMRQGEELIKRYRGNPLALKIAATPIKELFNSNIAAFLAQEALLFTEMRELLAQQFNRLSELERQVMYWLAINREPVTVSQLQADIVLPSVSLTELRDVLVSLDRRSLIEIKLTSTESTTQKSNFVSYTVQPLVMEYITEQLIERICQEVKQAQIVCLRSYALLKAQAKDDVQAMQMRLIVQPILIKLSEIQGGSENLKQLLLQLMADRQIQVPLQSGYFTENVLNLLHHLGADLSHLNLSNLTTWQANRQKMNSYETNFCPAKLSQCIFAQFISNILCVAFSSDSKYIATIHNCKEISVCQVKNGQITATPSRIAFWSDFFVFSPDVVKSWVLLTKECLKTLEHPRGLQSAFTFVPSPQTPGQTYFLASAGSDRIIWLWAIKSGYLPIFRYVWLGTLALGFQVIEPEVKSISFQPQKNLLGERRILVSSRENGTIRLLDSFTGNCLTALMVEPPDEDANISNVTGLTDARENADIKRRRSLARTNWHDDYALT